MNLAESGAVRRQILRDFQCHGNSAILVICAVSLAIAGFVAVLISYAVLMRDLNRGYRESDPPSAILRTEPLDDIVLSAIRALPDVADADLRTTVRGRIKIGAEEWRNLVLFVSRNPGQSAIAKLALEGGEWTRGTNEILIERDAFQVARTDIGKSVAIKLQGGTETTFRVVGRVHDVGQAQARMEVLVYGYIRPEALSLFGAPAGLDEVHLLVARDRFNQEHNRRIAGQVRALLESRGIAVRRVDVPTPGEHPHAGIMGLLLLAMAGCALAIIALSSVLVVNLTTALMASRVREIAVMKTIGASHWQIASIYLSQSLLLGAASVAVGLPIGVFGARMLTDSMAGFLNFDIYSHIAPLWVYALSAAIGLLMPAAAAAHPVWKAAVRPIRQSLSDFGANADSYGQGALDRSMARVGGTSRIVLLALRNSLRKRSRTALTAGTLMLAGLVFLCARNLHVSIVHTLDGVYATRNFDFAVSLGGMYEIADLEATLRNAPAVGETEGWIVRDGSRDQTRFTAIALPPNTRMLDLRIAEGRALTRGDRNAIVLNTPLASSMPDAKIGATVSLKIGDRITEWRVVGISRELLAPRTAYLPLNYVAALTSSTGQANSIRVKRVHGASLQDAQHQADQALEHAGVKARPSLSNEQERYSLDQHMLMIYVFLVVVSFVIASVGALGLATTMSLAVIERQRELAVLRAIGASPRVVALIIGTEGLFIGMLSWALAGLVAWPVSRLITDAFLATAFRGRPDFQFEPLGLAIWFAVTMLLSVVSSVLPAWRASRLTVREALAGA